MFYGSAEVVNECWRGSQMHGCDSPEMHSMNGETLNAPFKRWCDSFWLLIHNL